MSRVVWPKVVFFGDSLTQHAFDPENGRWGAILADKLQRKCEVICRGFSGYNSANCLEILPKLFGPNDLEGVLSFAIFLGANDCSLEGSKQRVPLCDYKENLTKMIKFLQSIGLDKYKLLLISPPTYDHDAWTLETKRKYGPDAVALRNIETVKEYVQAVVELGKEQGIETVNAFENFEKVPNWKGLFVDGLHFSASGSTLLADLLWPVIAKRTNDLPMIFPDWKDLPPCH